MSSRQRAASDFPDPDSPVMMTRRFTSRLPVPGLAVGDRRALGDRRGLDALAEAARQLARRVVPLELEEVVARGDLDEDGEVAPGAHRHLDVGKGDTEDLVAVLVEAQAVVALPGLPRVELDDVFDELRQADRRHAEEVLDVDDADAAELHVVAGQLGAGAHELLAAALDLDDVV